MKRILGAVGLLVLCGCVGGGDAPMAAGGMQVADQPLPPEVMAAIPGDLALSDVLVEDGCYFYTLGGQVYPVVSQVMRDNGMDGRPFCVG